MDARIELAISEPTKSSARRTLNKDLDTLLQHEGQDGPGGAMEAINEQEEPDGPENTRRLKAAVLKLKTAADKFMRDNTLRKARKVLRREGQKMQHERRQSQEDLVVNEFSLENNQAWDDEYIH